MEGRVAPAGHEDRFAALGALAASLGTAPCRDAVLEQLRLHVPALFPGVRVVLVLQVDDPSKVQVEVLARPFPGEDPSSTRPRAGSALARVIEVGPHRVDLLTSPTHESAELAALGYRDRVVHPITLGPSTVASLAVSASEELDDATRSTVALVATVLSAHAHRLAGLEGDHDDRDLGAQVVSLRQAAHTAERTDPLTHLPNRIAVFEAVAQARELADLGTPASLAFIDLDHYKIVNDAHGHALGDDVLVALAGRLREIAARFPVTFGRVGGDEFTAIANLGPDELAHLLEDLADDLQARPIQVGAVEVHASFSAGVFPVDGHGHGIEEIVSCAESAAYQAKREGRGRVVVGRPGDPTHTENHRELRAVDVMRSAVRHGRLRIVAQPIHAVGPGHTAPMDGEALVRLTDEQGRTLLPDAFVALAEQYDVVTALDRAVLSRVVELLSEHDEPASISCNLAPHSLLDPAFVGWATRLIGAAGVGPRLVLELTERLPVGRVAPVREAMLRLSPTGVHFALDDFGAGTTSYGNLRDLPVDVLKIDGTLVRGAVDSEVDRAMIRGIVDIARTLDVRVIAEGVETDEQLAVVTEAGVDAVQGFLLGTPSPWPAEPAVAHSA